MKLVRYVQKTVFVAMLAAVAGLLGLQLVFAYLGELDGLSETYTAIHAVYYTLYRVPYFLMQFMPTGVLLGAVIGLGLLSSGSEIVVMRAAGVSLYRLIGWTMMPAFLFVVLGLLVNQFLLPYASPFAVQLKNPNADSALLQGYWTLTDDDKGRDIIHIERADTAGNLAGISRYRLENNALVSAMQAKSAVWTQGYHWRLQGVERVEFGEHTQSIPADELKLQLPIDKHAVYLLTKSFDELSITDLYAHQKLMTHQGRVSKPHELALWQKLLSPFSVLSLLLVACSFVFGSLRSQSMGLKIVLALLTGLLFSYLQDLAGFVALVVDISPLAMVLLPIVVSAGLGVWLLNKKA